MKGLTVKSGSESYQILQDGGGFRVNNHAREFDFVTIQGELVAVRLGHKVYTAYCKRIRENRYEIWINDQVIPVSIEDETTRLLAQMQKQSGGKSGVVEVRAPMPGLVTTVAVTPGQTISAGMKLGTLEAMKMENEIKAPSAGTVKSIDVAPGAKVEKDQKLFTLKLGE